MLLRCCVTVDGSVNGDRAELAVLGRSLRSVFPSGPDRQEARQPRTCHSTEVRTSRVVPLSRSVLVRVRMSARVSVGARGSRSVSSRPPSFRSRRSAPDCLPARISYQKVVQNVRAGRPAATAVSTRLLRLRGRRRAWAPIGSLTAAHICTSVATLPITAIPCSNCIKRGKVAECKVEVTVKQVTG